MIRDNPQLFREWHRFIKQNDHFYLTFKTSKQYQEYTLYFKRRLKWFIERNITLEFFRTKNCPYLYLCREVSAVQLKTVCKSFYCFFFCNLISVTYIIIFTIFYHYYLIIIVDKGKAVKDARADFIQSMHCNNCTRVSTIGYLAGRLNSLLLLEPDNDSLNALASSKTTVPTKRKLPLSNILHKRGKWPTEWM